jgi:hypothetical protein
MNRSRKHEVYRFVAVEGYVFISLYNEESWVQINPAASRAKFLFPYISYHRLLIQFIKQVQALHKYNQERNQIRRQATNIFPQFLCP